MCLCGLFNLCGLVNLSKPHEVLRSSKQIWAYVIRGNDPLLCSHSSRVVESWAAAAKLHDERLPLGGLTPSIPAILKLFVYTST